ncbi:MAG: hypothetical protein LBN08_00695 [Lactobacillales bacterium]|jgi:hypothetical protein|nr:hypothetical protein [Lactobacillales bacterium]
MDIFWYIISAILAIILTAKSASVLEEKKKAANVPVGFSIVTAAIIAGLISLELGGAGLLLAIFAWLNVKAWTPASDSGRVEAEKVFTKSDDNPWIVNLKIDLIGYLTNLKLALKNYEWLLTKWLVSVIVVLGILKSASDVWGSWRDGWVLDVNASIAFGLLLGALALIVSAVINLGQELHWAAGDIAYVAWVLALVIVAASGILTNTLFIVIGIVSIVAIFYKK